MTQRGMKSLMIRDREIAGPLWMTADDWLQLSRDRYLPEKRAELGECEQRIERLQEAVEMLPDIVRLGSPGMNIAAFMIWLFHRPLMWLNGHSLAIVQADLDRHLKMRRAVEQANKVWSRKPVPETEVFINGFQMPWMRVMDR